MLPDSDISVQFQFHKGTIKTLADICIRIFDFNFNSIKVRLKPDDYRLSALLA